MEKITKEELLEQLNLSGVSDEDLEKIAGGEVDECTAKAMAKFTYCRNVCNRFKNNEKQFSFCNSKCYATFLEDVHRC
ncbi:MAG: hypothetical protein Q4F31_10310 [Eubacteriales bacterium]|nr:hypothetical protein [Eubacteriales bacterium]